MNPVVSSLATPEALATGAGAGSGGADSAGLRMSLTDQSGFYDALSRAQAGGPGVLEPQAVTAASESMQALFKPLEHINAEAASLHEHAEAAMAAGTEMTPGEMVMLTVRAHEFLFHSQLTANVANRASDGLQQLFRQQA